MKMFVISLCILLLLIGLWLWFYYTSVDPTIQYYWDNLSKLSETVEKSDWLSAKNDISLYYDKWREVRGTWVFFLNQKDVDNIESSIMQLNTYIKNENKILAQAELEHLKVLFYVIDENECLSLENVF